MSMLAAPEDVMRTGCLKLAPTMVALIVCVFTGCCSRGSSGVGSALDLIEGHALAETRQTADGGLKITPRDAQTNLDAAQEVTATKIAFAWLAALARHDTEALLKASRTPFVLRDAGGGGTRCKNTTAKDADQVLPSLKCLLNSATLAKVLSANSDPQGGPVPQKYLPDWADKWKKDVGPGVFPIAIVVVGKPASFDFVVLATPDGVHGLFKHGSHEAQN
jgi:hypothetical protein